MTWKEQRVPRWADLILEHKHVYVFQRYSWVFYSYGIRHCVTGQSVPDISKELSAFILSGLQSSDPIAQWRSILFQKNRNPFNHLNPTGHVMHQQFNLLATDFFFFSNFSTSVFKMWVIQKPNKVALWNKRNFEEKKKGDYTACLKYSVRIFVE